MPSDSFAPTCTFGESPLLSWQAINALCEVVHAEGLLCSTPLAGVFPPDRFLYEQSPLGYSPSAWFMLAEGVEAGGITPPANFSTPFLDFFAANLYPGRNFRAFNFSSYAAASARPFVVLECGIDAYPWGMLIACWLHADCMLVAC